MKHRLRRFIRRVLLLTLALGVSFSYASEHISFMTPDYRPLNYLHNGELKGPSIEILQLLQKKLNNKEDITLLPWKRAYQNTQVTINTALFSTTRTKERENLFKWVGPLAQKRFNIYALKSSNIKIDDFEQMKKYVVGVERSTINEHMLLSRGITNLSKVNYPMQNLSMILKNRIDLWSISSSTFYETLLASRLDPNDLEIVYTLRKAKLYIAFNKKTPDETIKKWQKAYDELYDSGKVKEIFKKHKVSYLYTK